MQTLDEMQAKINVELFALDEIQKSQQAVLDEMTDQRNQRQVVIESLSLQIDTDESRLAELQRDMQDLPQFVDLCSL